MKFKYFNYTSNFLKEIVNDEPQIYIFNNSKDKNYSKSFYNKVFGEKESLFLTFNEFKESIFVANKIVLREEKPALVFFNCLSKSIKEKLKITNYYDVIDTAYNFIKFYKEIKEYNIEKIYGLEEWQKELLNLFDEVKYVYDHFIDEKSYILPYMLNDFSHYNSALFTEYSHLNFVNIISFTPFEKKLVKKLEEEFNLTFNLQMIKGDFNEKKLSLEKITLPENQNIDIIEIKDGVLQLINLIENIEIDSVILDQNIEKSNYDKLISSNQLKLDKAITLENTKIFEFLSLWYELLNSVEFISKEFCIKISSFLNCLNHKVFQEYYSINEYEYDYFFNLVENDYKYISKDVLQNDSLNFINLEFSEKFIQIINDIETLYNFKTLNEYTHFIESKFDFKKLDEIDFSKSIYEDNIAKFFEALSEVLSIEDMDIIEELNWGKYFKKEKISENLLKLILKYLREKSIKTTEEYVSNHFITHPDNYPAKNDEMLIYLNINSETLPSKPTVEFLLTDKQRENIGLPSYENIKILEKYKFFRNIFSANRAIIFSIKNEEKNIDRSSFLEELILHYNLNIKSPTFSDENISSVIADIFHSEIGVDKRKNLDEMNISQNKLPFSELDYKNKKLHLGSYDYLLLMKCYYSFFFDKVAKVTYKTQDVSYKIDAKLLGLIIHSLFEKLSIKMEKEIKSGNFSITYDEIEKILNDELSILRYKLPVNFNKYYKEILFPVFINHAEKFYKSLEVFLGNEHIHNFSTEKSQFSKFLKENIEIDLAGRVDLLIESDKKNRIVDYKTGKGDAGQLDFYSILLYDDANKAEKIIYNAWDGEFIEDDRSPDKILTKDILELTLKEFINKGYYKRTDKKSECMKCEYINICRQRWEENE